MVYMSTASFAGLEVVVEDIATIRFNYFGNPDSFSFNTSYLEHTWCQGTVSLIPRTQASFDYQIGDLPYNH